MMCTFIVKLRFRETARATLTIIFFKEKRFFQSFPQCLYIRGDSCTVISIIQKVQIQFDQDALLGRTYALI